MSALAERMHARTAARRSSSEPRTLDAHGRLEALCDPGSLHVIRSTVLPRRESQADARRATAWSAPRHRRRPARVLLRAGPELRRRLARRGARGRRSCACCSSPGAPARRWSASSPRAARGWTRASPRWAATAASSAHNVRLSGRVPQISVITRRLGRRRRLLARAHRLRRDDRGVGDVPHRPRRGARGDGRGRRRGRARRPARALDATASAQLVAERRPRRGRARARPARPPAPARRRAPCRSGRPRRCRASTRPTVVPDRGAQGLRRART